MHIHTNGILFHDVFRSSLPHLPRDGTEIGHSSIAERVGSMEYIDSLLVMKDDLADDLDNAVSGQQDDMLEDMATVSSVNATESSATTSSDTAAAPGPTGGWPDWCVCKCCLPMPH